MGEGQANGGNVFSQHLSWEEINCDMQVWDLEMCIKSCLRYTEFEDIGEWMVPYKILKHFSCF